MQLHLCVLTGQSVVSIPAAAVWTQVLLTAAKMSNAAYQQLSQSAFPVIKGTMEVVYARAGSCITVLPDHTVSLENNCSSLMPQQNPVCIELVAMHATTHGAADNLT